MNIDFPKLWANPPSPIVNRVGVAASPIRITGVRGWFAADAQNSFARYDDLLIVQIDGPAGTPAYEKLWPASTDPSWALVVHPINPDGAAQLCEGIHLFERHLMHAGTPRQHWCLGQAEDVHVNRLNDDGTIKEARVAGQFGICIHSGGDGMDTGRFSAGCQIIYNPNGYFRDPTWTKFWGPIDTFMRGNGIATVPYLLTTKAALEAGGLLN